MTKPLDVLYNETQLAMQREKPRSRKRMLLQEKLQDLLTRRIAKETGYRRRKARR